MMKNNNATPLTGDLFCAMVRGSISCTQKQDQWEELREEIRFILCGRWGLDQYGSSVDLEETIDEILDAVLCSGIFRSPPPDFNQ